MDRIRSAFRIPSPDVSWTLYNDAAFSSSLWRCNNAQAAGPGDESCASTYLDANRTYYLKVTNLESVSSTYTVTVNYGGGSVGSRNNPMVLPIGTLYAGGVLGYGYSYYSITTGSSAMLYLISLTNTQADLQWDIYTDSPYSYSLGLGCNKATGSGDENCSTQLLNANTTYYLKVRSNSSNYSSYDLKATPLDPAQVCSGSAVQCFNFDDVAD